MNKYMNKNTHTHIYTGPLFPATKSMAAMCIKVVDSSQEVCCPIHPAISSWSKTFHSTASGKHGWFCLCKQASKHAGRHVGRKASKQQQATASSRQAASKKQASKKQAAVAAAPPCKQRQRQAAATSRCPLQRMIKYIQI